MKIHFYVNKENYNITISDEEIDDIKMHEFLSADGSNFEEMKVLVNLAIICFNSGKSCTVENSLDISPTVGLLFCKDMGNETLELLEQKYKDIIKMQ